MLYYHYISNIVKERAMANYKYIDVNKASEVTGLKPATLRKYARESRIPHYRYGGESQVRYRFIEEELKEWVEQHRVEVKKYIHGPRNLHTDWP